MGSDLLSASGLRIFTPRLVSQAYHASTSCVTNATATGLVSEARCMPRLSSTSPMNEVGEVW